MIMNLNEKHLISKPGPGRRVREPTQNDYFKSNVAAPSQTSKIQKKREKAMGINQNYLNQTFKGNDPQKRAKYWKKSKRKSKGVKTRDVKAGE